MAWIFSNAPSTYAFEQLNHSLSALSTIPISVPESLVADVKASPTVENGLRELSRAKPITKEHLIQVLETLTNSPDSSSGNNAGEASQTAVKTPVDKVVEAEIMARAVTVLWKETLEAAMAGAMELEQERVWWEGIIGSRTNVGLYFVQSLPLRLFRLIPTPFPTTLGALRPMTKNLNVTKLFHQNHNRGTISSSLRTLQLPISNPLTLTRREIMRSLRILKGARDAAAEKIGFLVSHGPQWASKSETEGEDNLEMIVMETTRLFALLGVVLDVPIPPQPMPRLPQPSTPTASPRRSGRHSSTAGSPPPGPKAPITPPLYAAPTSLTVLPLIRDTLPTFSSNFNTIILIHKRPSRLVRYWIPLMIAPYLYRYASQTARDNKDWVKAQINNAGETVKGWIIGWVWEPLEGVFSTLKGGGEGLGVAPKTVESDQASLERMILDLGRDHYHLQGEALELMRKQVAQGDMEPVLKVYEGEMKSPLKNALVGSLVRTLLIQVQKTKYDLSLSLLSLDHLLRSQQLTFAFVGLAPSLLMLYGLSGWLRRVWTGEKRGKGRKQAYAQGLRDVERLLITCGKSEVEMSDRDKGLLVLAVGRMRRWAGGLTKDGQSAFVDDLRMLEDSTISRNDKLRVVQRIWRSWGSDGRQSVAL